MATRFAVKTGVWSDTTVWDNGALPTSSDTVYPNGFVVTLDQDVTIESLNNNISNVAIPNIATPIMTSNTQPTGTVISSNNSGTAYYAFGQDNNQSLYWSSGVVNTGWLGYTFSTGKVIKRYFIRQGNINASVPKTWTFEGSNDGFATAGVILDTVASFIGAANTNYTSVLLANTTSYTSYRINITATQSPAIPFIGELEITENTSSTPVYGVTTGGSFTIPSSLSGTRNIVQSGAGIVSNSNNADSQVINVNATSGATVNFNISNGGYIFNQFWYIGNCNVNAVKINGNCIVNFNADIWGSQQTGAIANNTGGNIVVNANATININGNIYASKGHPTSIAQVINCYVTTSNSAVINITGNLIGTTTAYAINAIINCASLATTNITGSLTSGLGYCFYSLSGANLNIPTGTVTVTDLNSNPAILMTSNASLLTINSPIINKANVNACVAAKMRFYSIANPYWVFQNNVNADIILGYNSTGPYPAEIDVRAGITYSSSPTRTGTCAVPLPQYVSQGVPIAATVGTAVLTAEDFLNAISTSSNVVATRLKNVSTVQSTGDQIAAFNV
jgi:hypothetical protein